MPSNRRRIQRRRRPAAAVMSNPFSGRIVTPRYDPPQVSLTPFYHKVLSFEDPFQSGVAYFLTPANVRARLAAEFGIPANSLPRLIFKCKSIFIWSVADATSASVSVSLDVSSLVPTVSDDASPTAPRSVFYGIAARLVDTGTLNRPAAVGYHWSQFNRSQLISADQTFSLCEYSAGGNGYLRIQLHIDFSFTGTAPPFQ